jgi:16S rRNA C1402 (ribose-2'-O) methylase RsmI
MGRLFLIPWHIGDSGDLTFNAAAAVKSLRTLIVESVDDTRRELKERLKMDLREKAIRAVPEERDAAFLDWTLGALKLGDAGILASGGTPGFVDPGAWLIADLRARGVELVPLAGASCLATVLSLSGVEWRRKEGNAFTFAFFLDGAPGGAEEKRFQRLAKRREHVVVFLGRDSVERCLRALRPVIGKRPVTLFFDLTKRTAGKYPMADKVLAKTCAQWLDGLNGIPWDKVSDAALMVAP